MGLINKLFRKDTVEEDIRQLYRLGADDRMKRIMEWGDKGDEVKLKLLQYVILNDADSGIIMAALKRIHFFEDKKNVRKFLRSAKTEEVAKKYEPYYSMALLNTGLITKKEFEQRINQ